nr:Abi family protein [Kribbella sandramycini]
MISTGEIFRCPKPHLSFVRHFQRKYDGRLPVWVVTEILDFGSLSYLFTGLKSADRNEIAARLGILDRRGAQLAGRRPAVAAGRVPEHGAQAG